MSSFLRRLGLFFSAVAALWLLYLSLCLVVVRLHPDRYSLVTAKGPIVGRKVVIMGNSHPQMALNDSLLPSRFISVAQAGEPLFYTAVKARNIIRQADPDTIVIEFENSNLQTIEWVLSDENLLENYRTYFSLMTGSEHAFLFRNNPVKAFKTLAFLRYWDLSNHDRLNGGYRHYDKTFDPSGDAKEGARPVKEGGRYPRSLEDRNFTSLYDLLSGNDSIVFIVTRMPLHRTYRRPGEDRYRDCVQKLVALPNTRYLDFSDQPGFADSLFSDESHLNYRGARVFTPIFDSVFRSLR